MTRASKLAVCLSLSTLLHLLLFAHRAPDPPQNTPLVFHRLPRKLENRAFDAASFSLAKRQMQRLASEDASPRLEVAERLAELARPSDVVEELPPEVLGDTAYAPLLALEKMLRIERSVDVNIDSLLFAHLVSQRDFRERYARLPLANAGANREQAQEIIERAIEAMGGMKRLLGIKEMKAVVWIESNETVVAGRNYTVSDYLYPVATWHYKGWGERAIFTKERSEVKVSFDPSRPNPAYLSKRPERAQKRYKMLFEERWEQSGGNLPPGLGEMRRQGEVAHWHFIDRFMGEGITLDYLGQERSSNGGCFEVLLVDDRKFGHYFEALFNCHSALLAITREKLTRKEQLWFRQSKPNDQLPTWTTVYDHYQKVQGVLTPHRWKRTMGENTISIYLNLAYNGATPSVSEPTVR